MLGVIMQGLVEYVRYKKGNDGLKNLREKYGKSIEFNELKVYPDDEFIKFAGVVMEIMGCNDIKLCQEKLAPILFNFLRSKYPSLVREYTDLYTFLKSIPSKIHCALGVMCKENKEIRIVKADEKEKRLVIEYLSPNKLDYLMISMIKEAANFYKSDIDLKIKSLMSEGADRTVVEVKII